MSRSLAEWMRLTRRAEQPEQPAWSAEERGAFRKLRREARACGAILRRAGRGSLPPSLVLHVMRRDSFTCQVHADRGVGAYGGLELHHRGGILAQKTQHGDRPEDLVVMCRKAHDEAHGEPETVAHSASERDD